jgi:hypothetical protein
VSGTRPESSSRNLPEVAPVVEALPGLARVAGYAALHTAEWGARSYVRSARRLARAATNRDEAARLARDATEAAMVVSELAKSVSGGLPVGSALLRAAESLGAISEPVTSIVGPVVSGTVGSGTGSGGEQRREPSLRERGAELLERSRDVWSSEAGHPAYARILGELAPDEARILLLLLEKGPQPSVDVRTGGPIGMVSSQLIAPGLTMIGARSGARYPDQVPAYLNNLHRLGLVWFSREPLRDPLEYQVVEAQPDVLAAMHSVKFAKVVRRSIHLTPFGEDFCRTVLVDESTSAQVFPEHQAPPEAGSDTDA